ncbi:response regulator [Candidatus Pantoea floridensis]|nr:response regulator [Pantoea floridensis]
MATFIVVDDHPLARLAIRMILEKSDHQVLAEAGDGDVVQQLLNSHKPDALILDIDLPGINGIDVIAALRATGNRTPIVVMSGKNADYYAVESMKAGANGFISKQNNLEGLLLAVNAVLSGYGYFPLRMHATYDVSAHASDSDKIRLLSKREFEVLRYLAEGKEIISIAGRMKISNKTVSTYKARLMDKLGLKNQRDLLEFARRNNIN